MQSQISYFNKIDLQDSDENDFIGAKHQIRLIF